MGRGREPRSPAPSPHAHGARRAALAERGPEANPRPSIESQLLTREGSVSVYKTRPVGNTQQYSAVQASSDVHLLCSNNTGPQVFA